MLRILHTADWHLGQRLHQQPREYEHRCFLDWLLEQLREREVDALVVAGDIFDSANPPVSALRQFYDFVTRARGLMPGLQMVFVGGNHDSPARLESAAPLLKMIDVHVIGAITQQNERLETGRLLVPLRNRDGEAELLCAAMPYLRAVDLPRIEGENLDSLVEAVRHRYDELLGMARNRRAEGQALLATGHCYMVRGRLSELSERRILGGNQHALPLDLFGEEIDYVALGHLHLAQKLDEHIHYSGSPLPLSLAEKDYPHQVLQVDFDAGRLRAVESVRVPRTVEILRLPEARPGTPEEVMSLLETLELDESLPAERHPWLELRVRLERPEPGLWERFAERLKGRPVRFLKLSVEQGAGQPLADDDSLPPHLEQLDPVEVFRLRYCSQYQEEVPEAIMSRFHELLQEVQEGRA